MGYVVLKTINVNLLSIYVNSRGIFGAMLLSLRIAR